jgi:hypothetical protein
MLLKNVWQPFFGAACFSIDSEKTITYTYAMNMFMLYTRLFLLCSVLSLPER